MQDHPKLREHMTEVDRRELHHLELETEKKWNLFWVRLMHKHGYSNIAIAEEMGLTESSVRNLLA